MKNTNKILAVLMIAILSVSMFATTAFGANIQAELDKTSIKAGEILTVTGVGGINEWISIKLVDGSENVIYFDSFKTENDGKFKSEIKIPSNTAEGNLYAVIGEGDNVISKTLTVTGNGGSGGGESEGNNFTVSLEYGSQKVDYTLKDMKKMQTVYNYYSSINSYGTKRIYYGCGVNIETLLNKAFGTKDWSQKRVTVTSKDGANAVFEKGKDNGSISDDRFYYKKIGSGSIAGAQDVKAMLAWSYYATPKNTKPEDLAEPDNSMLEILDYPRVLVGQKNIDDVNNALFIADISSIKVEDVETISGGGGGGTSGTAQTEGTITGSMDKNNIINATVNKEELDKLFDNADKDSLNVKTIVLNINADNGKKEIKGYKITLPKSVLDVAAQSKNIVLKIDGISMTIPDTVLNNINIDKNYDTVDLIITKSDNSILDESIRDKFVGKTIYTFEFRVNNKTVNYNNKNSNIIIVMEYSASDAETSDTNCIVAVYITSDGKIIPVKTSSYDEKTNKATAKVSHFSNYSIINNHVEFNDTVNNKYKDSIEYLAARGIINGVGNNKFNTQGKLKRADFMLMLMRMLDVDYAYGTESFADVKQDAYYAEAIAAAKALGYTNGVGNNKFDADGFVSRQDMYTIVCRVLKLKNSEYDLSKLSDSNLISEYASEAVKSILSNKFAQVGTTLKPTEFVSRDEVAGLLRNVLEYKMK